MLFSLLAPNLTMKVKDLELAGQLLVKDLDGDGIYNSCSNGLWMGNRVVADEVVI